MTAYTRLLGTLGICLLSGLEGIALAQSGSFIQVRVGMASPGATFFVDKIPYTSSQLFRWQVGDIHTIRVSRGRGMGTFEDTTSGSPIGPGNDSNLGTRFSYAGDYAVEVLGGGTIPAGAFQDLTTPSDPEYTYRVQVWSFLQNITFTATKQFRLRFVTPAAGCAPTASGETLPGACGDIPGFTEILCKDGTSIRATTGDYWCSEGPTELTTLPGACGDVPGFTHI